MATSERASWLAPTLTLSAAWAVTTAALVVVTMATGVALPGFIAKAGPFILAGFVTGRLLDLSDRRPKITAAAVLAIVAALAWTAFSFVTSDMGTSKASTLLAASLPVMLVLSVWAYFGMFLGGRREIFSPSDGFRGDPEHDEIERELMNEIAEERRRTPGA